MEEHIWQIYLCFWLTLAGAALGSFLECAASRWAAGQPPFRGRSHCAACSHTLGPGELIPVLSFLLCRGRCRHCGVQIPRQCLLAELAGAGAFLCLGLRFGPCWELGQWLIFAGLLLALALADSARHILPDSLLLLLAANRVLWFFLLGQPLREAALAALLACAVPAVLLALVLLAERCTGRELMGGGDVKLTFALALYLSWAQLLLALLAGCLLGLLWAALSGKNRRAALAFGPFLAAGALLTLCFGDPVLRWYFSLF